MKNKVGKNKVLRKFLIAARIILVGVVIAIFIYLCSYSHSDSTVKQYLESGEKVQVSKISNGYYFDGPGEKSAIIFYPGAKVDTTAYAPMLYNLAEQGVDSFLIDMPFHIAFFGANRADKVIENYNYENWYMSGHSLGGAVASMYVSKNPDKINGLILLAAYPTKELPKDLSLLSIYGNRDGVLNKEKYEEGKQFWPEASIEACITGGNHAQFGNYGRQDKDYDATITADKQQSDTVEAILDFLISINGYDLVR